ncbi:uncharacterized protein [Euwallacea similis]
MVWVTTIGFGLAPLAQRKHGLAIAIYKMWWNILIALLLLPNLAAPQRDCSRNEYDRCVRIADPLVKEAHLVFPDNLNDIDLVCRTWNKFVDCLKDYTDSCFTNQQRRVFNRAVESPIESVHQMCMQPSYQKEYLQYAPCIKSTIVERMHCGTHYNLLVDQVEQGEIISKSTLCCSHDRFKQCVLRETRRLCDRGISDGPASRFASQIIEKALKFLQDQCINYIPNSGDCSSPQDSLISYSDRSDPSSVLSSSSSEPYPWSTTQRQDFGAREVSSSRMPKVSTSGWVASNRPSRDKEESPGGHGAILPTQHLGSRTRPASYGRSNSWPADSGSSTTLPSYTSPMFPGILSTPSSQRERFGSRDTWNVGSGYNNRLEEKDVSASPSYRPTDYVSSTTPQHTESSLPSLWNPSSLPTTETWYPAAGNQLTNEVDEPNQLGWQKPRNGGSRRNMDMVGWLLECLVLVKSVRTLLC